MDPLTASAFMTMTGKVAEMITEIVKGQSAEQRAQIWQWFIDDQTRLRKLLHIE